MVLRYLIYFSIKNRVLRTVLVEEKRSQTVNASKGHLGVVLSKRENGNAGDHF